MDNEKNTNRFIPAGIIFSFIASIIFPLDYFVDFEIKTELVLLLVFALSIGLSSLGIYYFLELNKKSKVLKIALKLSILSGLVYAISGSVRLGLETPLENILVQGDQSFIYALSARIGTSISFIWKMLFGLGLIFFSLSSFNHPRSGKILSLTGAIMGISILIINFIAFPESVKSLDINGIGPLLPFWNFLAGIIMLLSGKWINNKQA